MKKKWLSLLLLCALVLTPLAGCKTAEKEKTEPEKQTEQTETSKKGAKDTDSKKDASKENKNDADKNKKMKDVPEFKIEGNKITDNAGRTVELPSKIKKISPSGNLAQVMLYTIAPDMLAGWAKTPSKFQLKYMDKKYKDLPEFGSFFGRNSNMNMEAIIKAKPDVIIDVGEFKDSMKEDLDKIQEKTQIPTIFVHCELDSMQKAYEILGKVLKQEEQANKLAAYAGKTVSETKEKSAQIPEDKRVSFYEAEGDKGLQTNPNGSIQSEVLERVGAKNVCDLKVENSAGGNQVSMEQIITWNPDVLIIGPKSIYKGIETNDTWKDLKAVKDKKVYEIPDGPYNWVSRPPSVNRLIGLKWAGQVFYPDVYKYDMVKEAQKFYKLFYHYDLTETDAKELLKNSLEK